MRSGSGACRREVGQNALEILVAVKPLQGVTKVHFPPTLTKAAANSPALELVERSSWRRGEPSALCGRPRCGARESGLPAPGLQNGR